MVEIDQYWHRVAGGVTVVLLLEDRSSLCNTVCVSTGGCNSSWPSVNRLGGLWAFDRRWQQLITSPVPSSDPPSFLPACLCQASLGGQRHWMSFYIDINFVVPWAFCLLYLFQYWQLPHYLGCALVQGTRRCNNSWYKVHVGATIVGTRYT